MRVGAILLSLLVFSVSSTANIVETINVTLGDSGGVEVSKILLLEGDESGVFSQILPYDSKDFRILLDGRTPEYNISFDGGVQNISYFVPMDGRRRLLLGYVSQQLTEKRGNIWTLRFSSQATPYRTIVRINFPSGSTISWTPDSRFSLGPDILYVYPETEKLDFVGNYTFEGGGIPEVEEGDNLIVIAALLLLVFISVVVAYILSLRRKSKKDKADSESTIASFRVEAPKSSIEITEFEESAEEKPEVGGRIKDSVKKILDENEKKIVEVLENADEEITQAQICRMTEIPKASLSDIMRRLERRNVIERTREGRRNWVKLKKWVID